MGHLGAEIRAEISPTCEGMSRRNAGIGAILAVAILLGAAREFLFLNLNYAIDHLANQRTVSYAHSAFRAAVRELSLNDLVRLKWALTAVFIGIHLLLSILLARIVFGDHRYRNSLVIGFIALGLCAGLLKFASSGIPAMGDVAVKLLHVLQYPVILFFIWAASWLVRGSSMDRPTG
jgi:hypothetical protein